MVTSGENIPMLWRRTTQTLLMVWGDEGDSWKNKQLQTPCMRKGKEAIACVAGKVVLGRKKMIANKFCPWAYIYARAHKDAIVW